MKCLPIGQAELGDQQIVHRREASSLQLQDAAAKHAQTVAPSLTQGPRIQRSCLAEKVTDKPDRI